MITSLQNSQIKLLSLLSQKQRERSQIQKFVVEGKKEIAMAIRSGYKMETLYYCQKLADMDFVQKQHSAAAVDHKVFAKLSYRENSDGLIALFDMKSHLLNTHIPSKNPFYIVLESIEKPGNLGAVARTADALHADGVILCSMRCDIYNPNSIRASVGTLFSVNIFACTPEECVSFCNQYGIEMFATDITSEKSYYYANFKQPTAMIFGTEHSGLTPFWSNKVKERIKIPMLGMNDSLNVSVSVGIMGYELLRQREANLFSPK